MKLFKKTLAMVLAMAMLSSAAVFPAFATEEDPANVPGVEDVVEEPIAEEPAAEEPVVEEPTGESPTGQEWDTWDLGSSTFSVSGAKTVKVGETITLACDRRLFHSHSWTFYNENNEGAVKIVGDSHSRTVTIEGVTAGQVYVQCGWDSSNRALITVEGLSVKANNGTGEQTWTDASGSPFTYPSTTSVTVGGRKTLSASAVYTNSDGTKKTYSVEWSTGNAQVASVDANGNVRGVAEGRTTVVTATLTSGEERIVVQFPVTVSAAVPELDSTYAYYYILKPGANENSTENTDWSPFGIASVSKLAKPTSGATSYPKGNEVLTSLTPAPYFPAENTGYTDDGYADTLVKEPYPTYIKDGKTYIWVNDPDRNVNDYNGTYSIIWFKVTAPEAGGAGCDRNTNKGDYRTCTKAWVPSKLTWHVDGKVVTNDKVTVKFMVMKPGAAEYVLYSDALPMTYTENTLLSTISAPSAGTTLVNGVTCDLSDWYMDADLTQLKSANGSKTLGEYDTDDDGIIEIYAEYIPYTVTYQYKGTSSNPAAVVDKVYSWNTNVNVPLPYGPEGEDEGEYFAGWSYYGGVAYGNAESVAWRADTTGSRNMTLTAVYYTENVNTNYVINSDESAFTEQSKVSGVDAGRSTEALATPLFGAPEIRTINGQQYVIAKFNADFTAVTPQPDDGNDDDTGTVIAENGEYNYVGFALAAAGEEVATSPTVQGGYSFTRSNDVFQSIGSESLGGGFYIVIKLGTGVDYATPYVIDTNGVYYYGTALEIQ